MRSIWQMFLSWSLTLSMIAPLAQQQLAGVGQNALAHVLAHFGDQRDARRGEQLLGERVGDSAAVAKRLAKEAAHQDQINAGLPSFLVKTSRWA